MKDQLYFINDSDSDLNIRDKLKHVSKQPMKFLSIKQSPVITSIVATTNKSDYPMTEISEISQSLDSEGISSSGEQTNNFGANSDFKVVESASDTKHISRNPRKSVQNSSDRVQNVGKYRNSNIISFGKGHFSVYQSEKGNASILEEKDEFEKFPEDVENMLKNEADRKEETCLLKDLKSEGKKEDDGQSEHISTKSKGIQKSLYSVISNFYLMKKFISILRNATIFRRPKWLNSVHFKMINDWTFYHEGWIDNYQEMIENDAGDMSNNGKSIVKTLTTFKSILLKKVQNNRVLNKILSFFIILNGIVFHPTRLFRAIWDLMHMLIIICYLYIIPINLSFGLNVLEYFYDIMPLSSTLFKYITMVFFFLDIFVNMNTAYYNKGELIYDRRIIIRNYLQKHLFVDLLSLSYIFLKIFLSNGGISFKFDNGLGFFFLLRMRNLNRITSRIEEFILLDDTFFNFISLIKLIFGVLLLSHFFACLWHYISFINLTDETTWLNVYHLSSEVWWMKYISSYYFVVVVMNTVGFGDIVPQNYTEKIYSIFFIYFACGIFAYTINSIGIIVQDINKSMKIFKRNLHLINGYMKQKNISFDLRVRIRKYFEYIWKEERVHNEEETQEIINKLSKSLKDELLFEGNGTILKKLPLFYKNFSQDTLRKLVYEMKEINFTPGDIIYSLNDNYDSSLFIVRKGEVELYVETPKFLDPLTIVRSVKQGEVFGEISFFSGKERETFARSTTFTSLYLIKETDFLNIIIGNTQDYQVFCEIRDNINVYDEYRRLFRACYSCKSKDHDSLRCPLLHLTLSKQRILQRFNFSQPNTRFKQYERYSRKKCNSLKYLRKNEISAYKLLNLLHDDDSEDNTDEEVVSSGEIMTETSNNPIKKDFNKVMSEITEDDTISTSNKDVINTKKSSPKFNDSDYNNSSLRKNSFIRTYSKKSLRSGSNNNPSYFNFELSSNDIPIKNKNNGHIRSPYRKHLTLATDYQRQFSKESLSKYSINSRKSNKSNISKLHEISKNTSKKDIFLKSPLLQRAQESAMSINKYKNSEDSFIKDLSILLKKEKQRKVNHTDTSIPSKESKQKTSTTTMEQQQTKGINEDLYERLMAKTMTEAESNILCFDALKSFEFYFPHNNIENVVDELKENYEKK